jgi:hypothetical protein
VNEGLQTGGGGVANCDETQRTKATNPMIRWVLFIEFNDRFYILFIKIHFAFTHIIKFVGFNMPNIIFSRAIESIQSCL